MADPIQNVSNAISAYNKALKEADKPVAGGDGKGPMDDSFADLVKGALNEAVEIGKRSEQMSIAGITDQADLSKVITAVSEAEVTLQTVVAVRDKIIESYKQIIRMPM